VHLHTHRDTHIERETIRGSFGKPDATLRLCRVETDYTRQFFQNVWFAAYYASYVCYASFASYASFTSYASFPSYSATFPSYACYASFSSYASFTSYASYASYASYTSYAYLRY